MQARAAAIQYDLCGRSSADVSLLKQASQHPCCFFMHIKSLREQVCRGLVIRLVDKREELASGARRGFLFIDKVTDHLCGGGHAFDFLYRCKS